MLISILAFINLEQLKYSKFVLTLLQVFYPIVPALRYFEPMNNVAYLGQSKPAEHESLFVA